MPVIPFISHMIKKNNDFIKQVKQNSVALISLFIALSGLTYNTWRNEKTEENRNQRLAAFEVLVKINELQQVVFHHYYDKDTTDKGNLRIGWVLILTIQDLSQLLYHPMPQSSNQLKQVWNDNWQELGNKQESVDAVLEAINVVRVDALFLLKHLD